MPNSVMPLSMRIRPFWRQSQTASPSPPHPINEDHADCPSYPRLQVAENTALLKEFRDNIISILGRMDAMGGVMRQMPVLPVRAVHGPCLHQSLALT